MSTSNVLKETVRGTQAINIEDHFLDRRKIFLTGEVNSESCSALIEQVMYLESIGTGDITFFINSPGGDVTAGLGLYDVLMSIESKVKTVCIGTAASMGAILFLAGDTREMLPHSKIMIHDPSFGKLDLSGMKPHEIQKYVDSLSVTKESLAEIIAVRTGKPITEIEEITKEDHYYTANEAVEFGLATGITSKITFKEV